MSFKGHCFNQQESKRKKKEKKGKYAVLELRGNFPIIY